MSTCAKRKISQKTCGKHQEDVTSRYRRDEIESPTLIHTDMKRISSPLPRLLRLMFMVVLLISGSQAIAQESHPTAIGRWVGTWATAPQPCVKRLMPYNNNLTGKTVRQVIKTSIGGQLIRLRLSNEYSQQPIKVRSVYIASYKDSCDIVPSTAKYLSFNQSHEVTIPAGKAVTSDALKYDLKPLQRLTITINYAQSPEGPTVHPGSRTTSYIMKGVCTPRGKFQPQEKRNHWYTIAALEVYDNHSSSIAIIGNSITDGTNSTTNGHNRWPDMLSEYLQLKHKVTNQGVLNLGIGGNHVVMTGGNGEQAVKRFDRDILRQAGLKKVVIFEGVNDIGQSKGNSEQVAQRLITAYQEMINKAKARKLKVYLATITPFGNSAYYTYFHEAARLYVNEWIRGQKGKVDGIIDFDQVVRDPAHPNRLKADYQSDWLHPNPMGYKAMGLYAAEILK